MKRKGPHHKRNPLPIPGTIIEFREVWCLGVNCDKVFKTRGYLYKSGRWIAERRLCSTCWNRTSSRTDRMQFGSGGYRKRIGGSDG